MAYQTASGASLSISAAAPATFDAAGYQALTPDVVGEITNMGEFGKEWALVTHNPLATRGTKKGKGSYNNRQLNPSMALDENDDGQTAMRTALDSDDPVAFIIELQDGQKYGLMGLVMSFMPNIGGVDDIVTASTTIEINDSEIVPFTDAS